MKHIIIATTAINRPELHNDNMGEWLDWILELKDSETKIKWFVNIDIVKKLTATHIETRRNFSKIINNRVDTTFLNNPSGQGNFLQACKRLSVNIVNYVDNLKISRAEEYDIKIIWLEDDWKLNKASKIPIRDVINDYSTENTHINLSFNRNNYIWALAPSIISYNLWKNLFYSAWMTEAESIDPEHCVGLYYRRKYGNPDNVCNVTVINKSIKEKYLMERHMTFLESYYTYHTDKFQVNNNDRYILKDCLKSYLGDKITFIRITASFCIDGCTYGRNFLEKYNIEKSHSANVADFYTEKTVPPQVKKTEILEAPVEALVEAPVEAVVKAPVEAVVKSEELLELFEPEQSEQSEKIQLDYIGIDEFFKNSTSGINIEDDTKEMDLEFLNQINFEDDII
jgi:hypothetical protein